MNNFENSNVEPWYRWIFRRSDTLPFVTVYFLSRKNSTSPRFFPMYDNSEYFRIVLLRGLNIRGSDRVLLYFYKYLVRFVSKKLNKYEWQSPTSFRLARKATNNVLLHIDDPTYSESERESLSDLFVHLSQKNRRLVVACTNKYTKNYLDSFLPSEISIIVPQGHLSLEQSIKNDHFQSVKNQTFKVVYASPFIDIKGDMHEGHETWDASHLLLDLLPKMLEITGVEVHLIGRLGKNAEKTVAQRENVITYGLLPFKEVSEIIASSDLGLYPRLKDNFRSVQKITEYIGAGIPILTYDLTDSYLVKEHGLGKCVRSPEEFIRELGNLSQFPNEYFQYLDSVSLLRERLKWHNIVREMEHRLLEQS